MIIDLTLPLEDDMPLFPGYPSFESEASISEDTGVLTHRIHMSTHQGTHVDAPRHYHEDGATLDEVGIENLRGDATVVDLRAYRGEPISADILDREGTNVETGDIVLLLTGDVDERFYDDFFTEASVLTPDAAKWLVDRGVSVVGNDFFTEGLDDDDRPVHNTLLGANIPIVEYLCNTAAIVDQGTVEFVCVPLRLDGFEASPVRAFVLD